MPNAALELFEENRDDLRSQVLAEIERHKLTQAAICREAGVHASLLSPWLKGKYTGDNGKADEAMRKWLEYRQTREKNESVLPAAPGFIETPTVQRIIAALTYSQMAADLVVIYGGAGVGKTSAVKHYKAIHPSVWVMDATPSTNTKGAFLRRLCLLIGERLIKGHIDMLELTLIDRLRGTNGILIVDEAQFLNQSALESARRITELAGVGLALSGNESIYSQLIGRTRAADFAQLFSRIGKRVRLTRPTAVDVQAILSAWAIEGKEEQNLIKEIANRPGALRAVTKTLLLAGMFAVGKGQPIELPHIKAACKDLGGES